MNLGLSTRRQNLAIGKSLAGVPELLTPLTFFVVALCLGAVVLAVYSPALKFQFVLDDHRFTGDPRIQSPDHVWDYFANYVWAQYTGGPPSFYRPLFILWLRINFILSALSPWGWHLLSITKHLVVAVLLGLLVLRLLRDRVAALIAATLFALHPAQTESVAWVTVPDPLMSVGVLGALLLYLKWVMVLPGGQAHERKSRKTARTRKAPQPQASWLIASAAVCFAALLAKETAIVLPALIFVLALLTPQAENADANFGVRLMLALRQTVPLLCVTVLYLLMRLNALGEAWFTNPAFALEHCPSVVACDARVLREGFALAGPLTRLCRSYSGGGILFPRCPDAGPGRRLRHCDPRGGIALGMEKSAT